MANLKQLQSIVKRIQAEREALTIEFLQHQALHTHPKTLEMCLTGKCPHQDGGDLISKMAKLHESYLKAVTEVFEAESWYANEEG